MSSPAYVYFIKPKGRKGPIKIGCSDMPTDRLSALASWSPYPLEIICTIPGSMRLERNIHECFADAHSHREWFRPIPRLVAAIERLRTGAPVSEAIDLTARVGSIRSEYRRSPAFRLYMGFRTRLWQALKRAGADDFWLREPEDIEPIFRRAQRAGFQLGREDIRRLNEVIGDPLTHCERSFRKAAA